MLVLGHNLGQDPKVLWRKMVDHAQVQAMTQELVKVRHSELFFVINALSICPDKIFFVQDDIRFVLDKILLSKTKILSMA